MAKAKIVSTRKNRKQSNLPISDKPTSRNALALNPDGALPLFKTLPHSQKRLEVLKALAIVQALLYDKWEKTFMEEAKRRAPLYRRMEQLHRQLDLAPEGSDRYHELSRKLDRLREWRARDGEKSLIIAKMQEFVADESSSFHGAWEKWFLQSWDGQPVSGREPKQGHLASCGRGSSRRRSKARKTVRDEGDGAPSRRLRRGCHEVWPAR